jgi:hypothetical protein
MHNLYLEHFYGELNMEIKKEFLILKSDLSRIHSSRLNVHFYKYMCPHWLSHSFIGDAKSIFIQVITYDNAQLAVISHGTSTNVRHIKRISEICIHEICFLCANFLWVFQGKSDS